MTTPSSNISLLIDTLLKPLVYQTESYSTSSSKNKKFKST